MQIVINHLTRMRQGYICVAGIDLTSGTHVRPVMREQLPISLLARKNGPFDMAAHVELGPVSHVGQPPEMEDRRCNFQRARRMSTLGAREFWQLLERIARPRLTEIFGSELEAIGSACIVKLGSGTASLGCLVPTGKPSVYLNERRQIRMQLTDGVCTPNVSVTDLRLYRDDHVTPDESIIAHVQDRISKGVPMLLSVGLTRPFSPDGGELKHWLQVNNVHLQDNPTWQLG